jgi:hypothetical protein
VRGTEKCNEGDQTYPAALFPFAHDRPEHSPDAVPPAAPMHPRYEHGPYILQEMLPDSNP